MWHHKEVPRSMCFTLSFLKEGKHKEIQEGLSSFRGYEELLVNCILNSISFRFKNKGACWHLSPKAIIVNVNRLSERVTAAHCLCHNKEIKPAQADKKGPVDCILPLSASISHCKNSLFSLCLALWHVVFFWYWPALSKWASSAWQRPEPAGAPAEWQYFEESVGIYCWGGGVY